MPNASPQSKRGHFLRHHSNSTSLHVLDTHWFPPFTYHKSLSGFNNGTFFLHTPAESRMRGKKIKLFLSLELSHLQICLLLCFLNILIVFSYPALKDVQIKFLLTSFFFSWYSVFNQWTVKKKEGRKENESGAGRKRQQSRLI